MIKQVIRKVLLILRIDLTKNLLYDRLTDEIISSSLTKDSNCIDVGCHKGEILDLFLKLSPSGSHYAFEPIPDMYEVLARKYRDKNVQIFDVALSDTTGTTTFNFVKNAPAYSGLQKRDYDITNPEIEEIEVKQNLLDNIIDKKMKIDLLKVDVEGGEYGVLKGAKKLITRDKPTIIFEFGLGASEHYKTTPEDIYNYLVKECGMNLYNIRDWKKKENRLTLTEFSDIYFNRKDYYFLASGN